MKTGQTLGMTFFFVLFSSLISAQDVIYTIFGEIEAEKTSIDSIAVENLTNRTSMGFGNLPERDDYRINLTQKSFWGSTSVTNIARGGNFFITKNQLGSFAISSNDNIYNEVWITVYNINGQRIASMLSLDTGKNSSFHVEIGNTGVYLVSVSTRYKTQTFKVVGRAGAGNVTITSVTGSGNAPQTKSATINCNEDFYFETGDSIRISIFKNGYATKPKLLQISTNESFVFSFLACYVPEVLTLAADGITTKSAILHGQIVNDSPCEIVERGFFWSQAEPISYENKIEVSDTSKIFNAELIGLSDNTTYYFETYATNSTGTSYGEKASFTTQSIVEPTVTTDSITDITQTTATGGGDVTFDGGAVVLAKGVCWNTSGNPTIEDNKTSDGTGTGIFTSYITGLIYNTTYYVRAYATNSKSTAYGNQVIFKSSPNIPTVITDSITNITQTTATCGGIIPFDIAAPVSECGVCWNTNENPTIEDYKTTNNTESGSFISSIIGLEANTVYFVRAYATNNSGIAYGNQVIFTTLNAVLPTITTSYINNITRTTATVKGIITFDGGAPITAHGTCWNTSTNPTIADKVINDGTGTGSFIDTITGLEVKTNYHARTFATNSIGTAYSKNIFFTTLDAVLPTITTSTVTNISHFTAIGGGIITSDGGAPITDRGLCWSTSTNPTVSGSKRSNGPGTGSFTDSITGLNDYTTYYIRAYATNKKGTVYGEQKDFKTLYASYPTVTTRWINNITINSASGACSVKYGYSAKSQGICWSTSQNPTITDNKTSDGIESEYYFSQITGLTPNTTYYARAWAITILGTTYGNQISFKTLPELTVTTTVITKITQTKADGGGNVIYDGGEYITERGVCWSKSTKPTIADHRTINGSEKGSFSSKIYGLAPNNIYFARAYASNKNVTAYGDEISFKTTEDTEGIYFTDSRDGQSYKTVKIGNQTWMAENLAYLPVSNDPEIGSSTEKLYYVYGYWGTNADLARSSAYYTSYGTLYNWPAAMEGCPAGWHLPGLDEWITLKNYLADNGYNYDGTTGGGNDKIAKALAAQTSWISSTSTGAIGNNLSKNNQSGFSALPGGYRASAMFAQQSITGEWWCNTIYDVSNAYYFEMWNSRDYVSFDKDFKRFGCSVRCLKN